MGTGASCTRLSGIVFEATQGEVDGGGSARVLGHSILTRDSLLGDVRRNVRDAIECRFDEAMQRSSVIRLHFARDEIVLA